MTQVLRHTNTNSTHPLNMFYLRSVLLLRSSCCVYSFSLCAYDRSQMVHAVARCLGVAASILFYWGGNLVSYSSNLSSVTGLVCGYGQICSLPMLGLTQPYPHYPGAQQTVAAQGLGSAVVHEASHNKDSMLAKSFCSCTNTLCISGNFTEL